MEVTSRLRYAPGSAQKMRLVADLIRGKGVQDAVNLLTVTNKVAARHVQKCLKSAIANAENREDHVDVDRLFVKEVFVDGGPVMKRVRPAPMGRAYRVVKRTAHLTVKVAERPLKIAAVGSETAAKPARAKKAAKSAAKE